MKKQNTTADAVTVSPLAAAMQSADKAMGSAFSACRDVAALLNESRNPDASDKDEYGRLMKLAKDAPREAKILLMHERNILQFIAQHLLTMLQPEILIEKEKKKNGRILVPARECKTKREVQSAAKQIREAIGLADGRANNARAPKATKAEKAAPKAPSATVILESIPAMLSNTRNRQHLFKLIRAAGYTIEKAKTN